jgi:hypothetical protein
MTVEFRDCLNCCAIGELVGINSYLDPTSEEMVMAFVKETSYAVNSHKGKWCSVVIFSGAYSLKAHKGLYERSRVVKRIKDLVAYIEANKLGTVHVNRAATNYNSDNKVIVCLWTTRRAGLEALARRKDWECANLAWRL